MATFANGSDKVKVCGIVSRETEKALLIKDVEKADETKEDMWFPLSQVREIHHDHDEHGPHIIISRWLAETKGII